MRVTVRRYDAKARHSFVITLRRNKKETMGEINQTEHNQKFIWLHFAYAHKMTLRSLLTGRKNPKET